MYGCSLGAGEGFGVTLGAGIFPEWLVGYLHGISDQALQYVQNAGIDKLRARSREYVSYHLCRTTKRNGCRSKVQ